MNKVFAAVGQVVVGVIIGNAASDALNKGVDVLKKVVEAKKKEA